MLVLLLATCQQTLHTLEAAGNVLDAPLADDLAAMITRSERELAALNAKVVAAEASAA